MQVEREIASARDIRAGAVLELGPKAEILAALAALFPDMDLSDLAWGVLRGERWLIEFDFGQDDPVKQILLHIREDDERAISVIERICAATGWRTLDLSTGEFVDFREHHENMARQWRRYKDQAVAYLGGESAEKSEES
jgi:hypothetical protein